MTTPSPSPEPTSRTVPVALVAGASRGIGADTARAFARAGYAVVLGARDVEALDAVAGEIVATGGRAVAQATDVGDPASMRALVGLAIESFGRLDAAFNNATDGPKPAPLAEIDTDEFDRGIRTNVRGTFLGMKHQIPAMLGTGGAIVNMASVAGVRAVTNLAAYVAGKSAIIGLTEVAALDFNGSRHPGQRGRRPGAHPHAPPPAGRRRRPAPGGPVGADAPRRPHRRGGRRRPVAVLGALVVRHRCHHPHRRRPAGRREASPDVPPGRRHGADESRSASDGIPRPSCSTACEEIPMTTAPDAILGLGRRWAAAETAGDVPTLESAMVTERLPGRGAPRLRAGQAAVARPLPIR